VFFSFLLFYFILFYKNNFLCFPVIESLYTKKVFFLKFILEIKVFNHIRQCLSEILIFWGILNGQGQHLNFHWPPAPNLLVGSNEEIPL
jgi:hypothetical protein